MHVLIADDHPLVRDALALALQRMDACVHVHLAGDLQSALALCEMHAGSLSLALIDLNMPGMNGLCGLRQLRERFATLPLLVASGQDDPPTIRAVLAAGAQGFFPKSSSPALLPQAVQMVLAGGVFLPAGVLADLHDGVPPARADVAGLTPRQHAVLEQLLRGGPNKSIARELGLSEGTVKIHIAAILRALHARNRTEAVLRAHELGIGQPKH